MPINIQQALSLTADSDDKLSVELLLCHVLSETRAYLHAWPEKILTLEQESQFQALLSRYQQGEPIAYILGEREFWSLPLKVTSDTLIPRAETECLVTECLTAFPKEKSLLVADLGTGSGAIAIAIASERPHWEMHATDQSYSALAIAKENAERCAVFNIQFHQGNWCAALPDKTFDIIVTNPPYISEVEWPEFAEGLAREPRVALVSGEDGLDAIREIVATAKPYLKPYGALIIEHGYQQSAAVTALMRQQGYQDVHQLLDLSGHQRATRACWPL